MTAGDNDLILKHQGLVVSLARDLLRGLPPQASLEDLIAAGNLGLVEAHEKFDAGLGNAFSTFAYYRIRGAMLDHVRKSTWLPPALRRKLAADEGSNDVLADAASAGDHEPLEAAASRYLDTMARMGAVYLFAQHEDQRDQEPEVEDDPGAPMAARELSRRLSTALQQLGQPHRRVLERMYFEGKTMTQIAAEEGNDKATICRWHRTAIEDLRRALEGNDAKASGRRR